MFIGSSFTHSSYNYNSCPVVGKSKYMKPSLTKKQQILEAVEDLKIALLNNLEAEEKLIEVNREKTKTHKHLVMAQARLSTLQYDI